MFGGQTIKRQMLVWCQQGLDPLAQNQWMATADGSKKQFGTGQLGQTNIRCLELLEMVNQARGWLAHEM